MFDINILECSKLTYGAQTHMSLYTEFQLPFMSYTLDLAPPPPTPNLKTVVARYQITQE